MTAPKTKCRQCHSAGKKAIQEPCCKCSEINDQVKKFENQFLEANKNLIREE